MKRGIPALILTLASGVVFAENPVVTVALGGPPSTYMIPLYVAQDAGLFAKDGVDVKTMTVSGDQNSMRAVLTGDADVAVIGPPIMYETLGNGGKVKTIAGWQETTDYYLILGKGKGSTIKDAAGKTLAVSTPGSMPQIVPEMIFKKNNIDSTGTKYAPIGGNTARIQAVISGKIDGTIADTLNSLRGERSGKVTLITTTAQQFPEGLGYILLAVKESELTDPVKRKALLAFVKGSIEGARMTVDQPVKAADIFYKKNGGDVDLQLIKDSIQQLNRFKVWGVNGGISKSVHDFTMKTYVDFGLSKNSLSYDQVYDPSLVNQLLKEIGTR
ncbi:MAG: ABC transporter substrate-binding protein [Janthinobacterium lividum]